MDKQNNAGIVTGRGVLDSMKKQGEPHLTTKPLINADYIANSNNYTSQPQFKRYRCEINDFSPDDNNQINSYQD